MSWPATVGALLGVRSPRELSITSLAGGCVGEVLGVSSRSDPTRRCVVKLDAAADGGLLVEAQMLGYLASHAAIPVPAVRHVVADFLVLEWLPGSVGCPPGAEPDAARLLAGLHSVRSSRFGFDTATRIGGLVQPNPWCDSWVEFFGEQRLLHLVRALFDAGRLDVSMVHKFERLVGRLGEWIDEPAAPALLHGDLWSGNLLCEGGRVTGLIDPAISFGHPEMELAFGTMFGTFTSKFYDAYREVAGWSGSVEFFDVRRYIYNLYPLLVHARLFGGGYVDDVRSEVARFV